LASDEQSIPAADPLRKEKEQIMIQARRFTAMVILLAVLLAGAPAIAAESKAVVNINTADIEALMLLPRVGPSVARRIVEFREKNGKFKTAEDLMLVSGVGEKTFALIKPYVTISGETTLVEKVRVSKAQSEDS